MTTLEKMREEVFHDLYHAIRVDFAERVVNLKMLLDEINKAIEKEDLSK